MPLTRPNHHHPTPRTIPPWLNSVETHNCTSGPFLGLLFQTHALNRAIAFLPYSVQHTQNRKKCVVRSHIHSHLSIWWLRLWLLFADNSSLGVCVCMLFVVVSKQHKSPSTHTFAHAHNSDLVQILHNTLCVDDKWVSCTLDTSPDAHRMDIDDKISAWFNCARCNPTSKCATFNSDNNRMNCLHESLKLFDIVSYSKSRNSKKCCVSLMTIPYSTRQLSQFTSFLFVWSDFTWSVCIVKWVCGLCWLNKALTSHSSVKGSFAAKDKKTSNDAKTKTNVIEWFIIVWRSCVWLCAGKCFVGFWDCVKVQRECAQNHCVNCLQKVITVLLCGIIAIIHFVLMVVIWLICEKYWLSTKRDLLYSWMKMTVVPLVRPQWMGGGYRKRLWYRL